MFPGGSESQVSNCIAWTHRLPPILQMMSEKIIIKIASVKQ